MSLQTLNGKQIRNNSLEDKHIKDKLSERVLDIKWQDPGHAADILKNKPIIDYVQNIELMKVLAGHSSAEVKLSLNDSGVVVPGVILNEPLRFRDANGDPLRFNGKEIIGKITVNNGAAVSADGYMYLVEFTDHTGAPFVFEAETDIEFLYPIKTTLWDAAENFASNERFIDGGVDIRTRLDIIQLAKDVYGGSYSFNADGLQTKGETLNDMLLRYAHGSRVETDAISSTDIIDEVYDARGGHVSLKERLDTDKSEGSQALEDFKTKLTSTATGNGTALVGHDNTNRLFASDRLFEILEEIGGLVKDAEGSQASITARLAESLRESGVLKDNEKIHVHGKHAMAITSESSTIVFADQTGTPLESLALTYGIDDIEVYYNGNLQAETFHYTVTKNVSNIITGIDLSPDTMIDGDVVILKWTIYNKHKA